MFFCFLERGAKNECHKIPAKDAFEKILMYIYEDGGADMAEILDLIDGNRLLGEDDWRACSVDCTYPNDLGHYRMAKNIIPVIQKIWRNVKRVFFI